MAISNYQVILSTDGKHTVIASGDDQASAKAAVAWASAVYDRIVAKYGLKKDQYKNNGELQGDAEAVPECGVHHLPMLKVQGKKGDFWSCHHKNDDGSWCSYKPSDR